MRLLAFLLLPVLMGAQNGQVIRVPMRDGVRLSTNVFLPTSPPKVPALLVRTPYGKGAALIAGYKLFIDHGFAVVVQDVRGRYDSQGVFRPPLQEDNDGNDTINWIAAQPWSDGSVGMLGGSYLGIAQWRAALQRNPHLRAIFPVVAGSDEYLDRFYSRGGAYKIGHRMLWIAENLTLPRYARPPFEEYVEHLPLRMMDRYTTGQSISFYQESLNHPFYDGYWRARSTRERLSEVNTPAFIVGGWYDNYVESDLATFVALRKRSGAHRILIGPWPHNMSAEFPGVSFGRQAGVAIRSLQLDWFTHWLRGPVSCPGFSTCTGTHLRNGRERLAR
jgi:putative CocE/NonD family hydrolase